jgi:hypothetical protein
VRAASRCQAKLKRAPGDHRVGALARRAVAVALRGVAGAGERSRSRRSDRSDSPLRRCGDLIFLPRIARADRAYLPESRETFHDEIRTTKCQACETKTGT